MLFYERREKRPLRLLEEPVPKPQESQSNGEKEEEKVKEVVTEVDYRAAVTETDMPSKRVLHVLEENRKFGFENDIYSQDFFDFLLTIQKDILA
jgi:hypothetical protein